MNSNSRKIKVKIKFKDNIRTLHENREECGTWKVKIEIEDKSKRPHHESNIRMLREQREESPSAALRTNGTRKVEGKSRSLTPFAKGTRTGSG